MSAGNRPNGQMVLTGSGNSADDGGVNRPAWKYRLLRRDEEAGMTAAKTILDVRISTITTTTGPARYDETRSYRHDEIG
jgi:hypothetical protein